MRCVCNRLLSDYEATRRHKETGEFLDLCNQCLSSVLSMAPFETVDRPDLMTEYLTDCEDLMDGHEQTEYNTSEGEDSRAD